MIYCLNIWWFSTWQNGYSSMPLNWCKLNCWFLVGIHLEALHLTKTISKKILNFQMAYSTIFSSFYRNLRQSLNLYNVISWRESELFVAKPNTLTIYVIFVFSFIIAWSCVPKVSHLSNEVKPCISCISLRSGQPTRVSCGYK